jgi:hypothetical protein
MASCPHDCARCRAIEAGYAGRALTPAEFLDLFEIIASPSSNGVTPPTIEAAEAVEAAEKLYDDANDAVGELIAKLQRSDDQELEEALELATLDRDDAADRLQRARLLYQGLRRRDSDRHFREEYEADQDAIAEARREAHRARQKGSGILAKLRGQS